MAVRGLKKHATSERLGAPLAGLLTCGQCGGSMYYRNHGEGYLCGTYVRGHGCHFCFVPETWINAKVSTLVIKICGGSLEAITEAVRKRLETERKPDTNGLKRKLEILDGRIETALERLLIVNARLVPDLETKLLEMREDRDRLAAELKAASKPTAPKNHIEIAAKLWALGTVLRDSNPAVARARLKEMFSTIRLDFKHDGSTGRGQKYVLVGGVAFGREEGDKWRFSAGD